MGFIFVKKTRLISGVGRIPWYKFLLSYIQPVWLKKATGEINPYLELLLYRGRVQLATEDALYSDGRTYAPAVLAEKELRSWLPNVKQVLVLGAGLGSLVEVLHGRGYSPRYTLVELDNTILKMAMEHLSEKPDIQLNPICDDAAHFITHQSEKYDLLFIDIFQGRVVPSFVTSVPFLTDCKARIAPGGRLVMNYIENDPMAWKTTLEIFRSVFPQSRILYHNINRIFVAEA